MTQTIQLAVQKDNVNLINQALNSNQPTKIAAEEGMKISLVEAKTGLPAKKLKAKKVDDDLLIADENGETLLTIEDYYLTDNIQLGTVGDSGFVEFDYVNSETGVTSQIASETSYTTLVSEMLSDTSFIGGISNGVLLGSLGAAALGIAALSSGSSDDSPKTPANKIPVSKDSIITATEDTIVSGKLEAATDADGDALTYAIATGATNGKVVIGKDGSYSYTPNANFNGKDSFTYTINDGQGGVITQTATISVAAVNDAPEITPKRDGSILTDITFDPNLIYERGKLEIADDGKIIVAETIPSGAYSYDYLIQRFNPDGTVDLNFGNKGLVYTESEYNFRPTDILIESTGKIIIARNHGYRNSVGEYIQIGILKRFNEDGSIDTEFGENGIVEVTYDKGVSVFNLESLDDGRIVVTGIADDYKSQANQLIAIYDNSGQLDSSFSSSKNDFAFGKGVTGTVLETSDGGIIVFSHGIDSSNSENIITKYDHKGNVLFKHELERDTSLSKNLKIIEGDNGEIIIAHSYSSNYSGKIIRLNSDLSLDTTFNSNFGNENGYINLYDLHPSLSLGFSNIQYLPDGKLLVTASVKDLITSPSESKFVLLRFNEDGTLDDSFGNGSGIVITDFTFPSNIIQDYNTKFTLDGDILLFTNYDNINDKVVEKRVLKFDKHGNLIDDFGPSSDIISISDNEWVFHVEDFNFSDSDGNQLKAVIIDTLPESGELLLNGLSVNSGQVINVSLIESGQLIYQSETDITNDKDINITYRVQDDGGTENGGVDISEQGTLVIKVLGTNVYSNLENIANDYFSESIDLSNATDTYYDSSANLPLSFDSSVGQMETLINSPQTQLPSINDLLDLNSNELMFEQTDVSNATPSSDIDVTSVSEGATDNTAMTVDFTIGQVQDFNDMQTEAMFHIM